MEKLNNAIRNMVSGERNRLKEGGFDLDLTYITDRILAMSFPAGDFVKKLYRNNIADVSRYINERHGSNYWIYNMSGIDYDTSHFDHRVHLGTWEDHHSPTLCLLVEFTNDMFNFLQKDT